MSDNEEAPEIEIEEPEPEPKTKPKRTRVMTQEALDKLAAARIKAAAMKKN